MYLVIYIKKGDLNMKRYFKCLSSIIILSLSILVTGNTSLAAGWLNNIKGTLNLNSIYNEQFVNSDIVHVKSYTDVAYNVYKFSIPEKGFISLQIESENEDFFDQGYNDRVTYSIYKTSNLDKPTDTFDIEGDYSKARGIYTGSKKSSVSKGEYYLVVEADVWADGPLGEYGSKEYSLTINYSPAISQPVLSKISASKKSIKISWTKINMADSYEIQISKSKSFPKSKTKVYTTANGETTKKLFQV